MNGSDERVTGGLAAYRPDYRLDGKVCVITGATGVLGSVMAKGVAAAGARVAVLGRRAEVAEALAEEIRAAGGEARATPADVLDRAALERVRHELLRDWGSVDLLVNAAGGNQPGATLRPDQSVLELEEGAMRQVMDLNFFGTLLPTQVFLEPMVAGGRGAIVNVSSMAAAQAITRVAGYSAAKAAVENLTRWLATTLAKQHGPGLRVNAIAPGFFVAEQNRALLFDASGELTPRGRTIIDNTPMGRFGEADELLGALVWLLSDASRFVTGVVVPIDGGFSAFSGV
ncbi:MAG TPA: SDR family oxidoreductase [Trueperaceae bacterium]|mgnify:FL=1|nr:SDR family oxidoreductase [Trueperaceae bacterium]